MGDKHGHYYDTAAVARGREEKGGMGRKWVLLGTVECRKLFLSLVHCRAVCSMLEKSINDDSKSNYSVTQIYEHDA